MVFPELKKTHRVLFFDFLDLSSPRDAFSTHHFLEQFNMEKPRYARVTSSQIRINRALSQFSHVKLLRNLGDPHDPFIRVSERIF